MYLAAVLRNKPSGWDEHDYRGIPYARIPLDSNSREFKEVLDEFRTYTSFPGRAVLQIERIQHPFAYGRYEIRKRQLQVTRGCVPDKRVYLYITDSTKIDQILRYNCDARRGGFNKYNLSDGQYILLVKQLSNSYGVSERDSDLYPEYLIKLDDSRNTLSDIDSIFMSLTLK